MTHTHTHTKTHVVVSNHMLRRTARRKERRLDNLTSEANPRSWSRANPGVVREARQRLENMKLPPNGEYETRKAPRGPWRWQVIVWS